MEKLSMTITQLASVAGCSRKTVDRLVKTMFPDIKTKKGVAKELNQQQCSAIMDKLPKKNYIEPMTNVPSNLVQSSKVDYELIGKMIATAVSSAMKPLIEELKITKNQEPLQLEHVPEIAPRKLFVKNVDELVRLSKSDHSSVYNRVYSEMGYLYGVKIKARAKKRGVRPIEVLESDNFMGKAVAVTRQMIKQAKES